MTFDNLRFSCHVRGEFIALHSVASGAQVQTRFEKHGEFASLATAVAATAGVGTRVVQLSIVNNHDLQLFVDNELIAVNDDIEYEDSQVTVYRENGYYFIFFKSTGRSVRVRYDDLSFRHLSIRVSLPPGFRNDDIRGLLGSPDSDPRNDWTMADGTVLDIPANPGDQGQYDYCRQNWCIADESESIFTYSEEANFFDLSGCFESFPGTLNLGNVSPEVLNLCGTNAACIENGIELRVDGAQKFLEGEAELLRRPVSSRFTVDSSAVQVGINRAVTLSVNLTQEAGTALARSIEEFHVFRVNSETREIGQKSIATLHDDGLGVGNDVKAGDFIFSNVLAIKSSTAGESLSFFAVPVIAGTPVMDSEYAVMLLHAVTFYSMESAIGIAQASSGRAVLTRDLVAGLILVIQYSWPADQLDLDTGTFFLGQRVGFACGSSSPYLNFSGEDTSTDGIEIVRVALGDSFAAEAWSDEVLVDMNAQWNWEPYRGPATLTIFTALMEDGEVVPHNNAIVFLIDPGVGGGCASKLVAQARVQVDPKDGMVSIGISTVSE